MSGRVTPDRGFPLEVGVLVPADDVASLAPVAEEAGLDVVAVAEASPGPGADGASLDAWTALAFAAGRTSRVGLAAVDLTVDNPVLLARSAASLDLLTDGRVRVGLADQPGLDEAVPMLRATWRDETVRGPGPVHVVPGAPGGPVPAHDVPVWTRTEVTGADASWGTPSSDLRRLVTLGETVTAEELTRLVVDDGASVVLVAAASAEEVRTLGAAAAGARAAVARTRAERGTPPAPSRPAHVRARRRPGIDYDAVPVDAVEPGDVRFADLRSTYLRAGSPGLVLLPRTTEEVAKALTWARGQAVDLAVRSGGHGMSGRSTNDGGIVLSLRRLASVDVIGDHRVRVGPGARWGDVAQVLRPHGWAVTSGDFGGVGVGGLATAGGIGFLGRLHGLTIDHVRAVEVVLADGSVTRADAEHEPDLFWGVRGAGANLGVVTSFELEAPTVGDVGFAQLTLAVPDLAQGLVDLGALVERSPRDVTPFVLVGRSQGIGVLQVMAMVASGDPDVVVDRLQPFAEIGRLVQQRVTIGPYAHALPTPGGAQRGYGEPVTRSGLVQRLTPELARDVVGLVESGEAPFFQIRSMGGAIADVAPDATAFPHRSAGFSLLATGRSRRRLDVAWAPVHRHVVGIYSSFETDLPPERITEVWPGETLERLRELKRRYDPDHVFRHNTPITP